MAGGFTVEDAPETATPASGFTVEDAPHATPQPVTKTGQPSTKLSANEMMGEGQELEAQGRAALAPTVVPGAVGTAAEMVGGPVAGGAAYLGTKSLMAPEEVKAHPIRTAAETAGMVAAPYALGKVSEYLAPTLSRLTSGAGKVFDYLKTPGISTAAREAEPAIAATAPARVPLQLPEHASGVQVGPSTLPEAQLSMREQLGGKIPGEPPARLPANAAPTPAAPASTPVAGPTLGPPLTNRQIAGKIVSGVKNAAGMTDKTPLYPRPIQGTVGAKTVADQPNTEIQGPPIATPSRDKTLVNYAGENVEKSAARTPMQARNENAFYRDFSPRERQDIHTNMEVRTPNGYEPIPNAEQHWERLSQTPEVREDLFKMQNDQVREALRKSGLVDMQNKTVKSSDWTFQGSKGKPFRDPNVIPRAKALQMMWEKGIADEDIIKWGGGEETRSKPYLPRTTAGPTREGLTPGPADRGYPEK